MFVVNDDAFSDSPTYPTPVSNDAVNAYTPATLIVILSPFVALFATVNWPFGEFVG